MCLISECIAIGPEQKENDKSVVQTKHCATLTMPESNFMIGFYGISKIRKTCRESGSMNAWSQSTD